MAGSAAETPTMTLSDTQRLVLSKASQHEQGLAAAPRGLPAAARDAVFRSMLVNGLLAECAAPREYAGLAWRQDADGAHIALRITDTGLRASGVDPAEGAAVTDAAPAAAPDAAHASEDAPSTEAAQGGPTAPLAAPCEMTEADIGHGVDLQQAALDAEQEQTWPSPVGSRRRHLPPRQPPRRRPRGARRLGRRGEPRRRQVGSPRPLSRSPRASYVSTARTWPASGSRSAAPA
jgi:hypothetical protein